MTHAGFLLLAVVELYYWKERESNIVSYKKFFGFI